MIKIIFFFALKAMFAANTDFGSSELFNVHLAHKSVF